MEGKAMKAAIALLVSVLGQALYILLLLADGARLLLVAGNVLAILAGMILVFRPSLLKGVEGWTDRQYSPRLSSPKLDEPRYQPDEFVRAHLRLAGALATLGSLFVL